MRILVTNDDGVDRPGLLTLAVRLAVDHEVVVAAPSTDRSGSGAGLGRVEAGALVEVRPVRPDGLGSVPVFAVDGPPSLVVRAVCDGVLDWRPDLVVSGVNPGVNTGGLLVHSGTFGAVVTGASSGVSGIAISAAGESPDVAAAAAEIAACAVGHLQRDPPMHTALNINVPSAGPRGAERTFVARPSAIELNFGASAEGWIVRRSVGTGPFEPGSDADALSRGVVSVSALSLFGTRWDGLDGLVAALCVRCAQVCEPSA